MITVPAVIIALTFHEYAHARIAYHYGDPTAKNAGRLTLNPLKHLDIMGTILLIIAHFGWAKPVPVNPNYFDGDRRSKMVLVSMAGPVSNLLLAFIITLILMVLVKMNIYINPYVAQFILILLQINIILAVFNLIPIPPLDGSKILAGFLPESAENLMYNLERYGFLILMVLIFTGVFSKIINPFVSGLYHICLSIAGII